jgi:hypothetical protein
MSTHVQLPSFLLISLATLHECNIIYARSRLNTGRLPQTKQPFRWGAPPTHSARFQFTKEQATSWNKEQ